VPEFRYSIAATYDEDAGEIELLTLERETTLTPGEIIEFPTRYPQRFWMVDEVNQVKQHATLRPPRYAEVYVESGGEQASAPTERDDDLRRDYSTLTNEGKSHYQAIEWQLERSELRSDEHGGLYWALLLQRSGGGSEKG
jgi:hypothetical protein